MRSSKLHRFKRDFPGAVSYIGTNIRPTWRPIFWILDTPCFTSNLRSNKHCSWHIVPPKLLRQSFTANISSIWQFQRASSSIFVQSFELKLNKTEVFFSFLRHLIPYMFEPGNNWIRSSLLLVRKKKFAHLKKMLFTSLVKKNIV